MSVWEQLGCGERGDRTLNSKIAPVCVSAHASVWVRVAGRRNVREKLLFSLSSPFLFQLTAYLLKNPSCMPLE